MLFKKILLGMMLITSVSFAQSGGDFLIKKSSIDAGGGVSDGGSFKVIGSIGQADATSQIAGGSFKLSGGFWSSGLRPDPIFKNGFE